MLRVIFLGTGGALPTRNRNPSSILINREGELIFFDCGEGTQRQMMKARTGMMSLTSVFITHFHADHILGLPGLIQTMSFQGRTMPLVIYGPAKVKEFAYILSNIGYYNLKFEIRAVEVQPGDIIKRDGYSVKVLETEHSVPSVGYALVEDSRPGKFNRDRAIELGVPVGPLFSKLQNGIPVEVDGKVISPDEVIGPSRPGRTIVYSGDTRPSDDVRRISKRADLLIHEATLADEKLDWAIESMHTTAGEAAKLAAEAEVKNLILTHISSRYTEDPSVIYKDAKKHFKNVTVAEDLMEIEVPYSK